MERQTPGTAELRGRQNDPPLLILLSLAESDKHGHALAADIEQMAGVRLGPGTLYGAIARLEERGLIEPLAAQGRRRPYRLTDAGLGALHAEVAELRRLAEAGERRLGAAGRRARAPRAGVLRAPRWTA